MFADMSGSASREVEPPVRRRQPLFNSQHVNQAVVPWDPLSNVEREQRDSTVLPDFSGPVLIPPDVDPQPYFDKYSVLWLSPSTTYQWPRVLVRHPVVLEGFGARVELHGTGPQLEVAPSSSTPLFMPVYVRDVLFFGSNSIPDTAAGFARLHSAIHCNIAGLRVEGCWFENYKGAAVVLQYALRHSPAIKAARMNQQNTRVTHCSFRYCKIGVATAGGSEYGLLSGCQFYQCHLGIYSYSGTWVFSDCMLANCKIGIMSNASPWYVGPQISAGYSSIVSNCIISHCGSSMWPDRWLNSDLTFIDGPIAVYFDRPNLTFFNITGCVFADVGVAVGINTAQNKVVSVVGCTFVGTVRLLGQGVGFAFQKDKVFFLSCSGTEGISLGGCVAGNNVPPLV